MMAQAASWLLLLLLLLMGISGSQGQVSYIKYQEGQTLKLSCSYDPQKAENRWKTWCKLQENGRLCDRLITRMSILSWRVRDQRAYLEDDNRSGVITISMSNLRVNDSGTYWCGIYDAVNNTIDVIRTISLEVSSEQKLSPPKYSQTTAEMPTTNLVTPVTTSRKSQSSIVSSSALIQVLYGLIVTKGLVFTALVVLLARCRGPGRQSSQSELSQDQNDRK